MVYKLSNAAERSTIEDKFDVKFKHPNLYQPKLLIDGLVESSIPTCTMKNPNVIDFAIWGLMPNNYKEDWVTFQNAGNTLNFDLARIKSMEWTESLLEKQRSLAIVTGYFCYYLRYGEIYPYYVSLKSEEPFFIGSVYTELEDGFLSSGILTTKTDEFVSTFHNVDQVQPLLIPESVASNWLDDSTSLETIENIIKNPPKPKLKANPIAREFFKNNIIYDTILQPVYYEDIPKADDPKA